MKRILGIDPGLNTTGYGVIEGVGQRIRLIEAGVIRTQTRGTLGERLAELHEGIAEVLAAHRPELMALEQLFSHYERPRTAILMGHARGVICLNAQLAGVPIQPFEPTRVKRLLTGNGRAPKQQMQLAVQLQLGLPTIPQPPDVADALAIALCGFQFLKFPAVPT